jgi:hypothetical protein
MKKKPMKKKPWEQKRGDIKWLKTRLGANNDPWIQAQIAKLEDGVRAETAEIQQRAPRKILQVPGNLHN